MLFLSQAKFNEIYEFFAHFTAKGRKNEQMGQVLLALEKKPARDAYIRILGQITAAIVKKQSSLSGSDHLCEAGFRYGIAAVSTEPGRWFHAVVAILRPRLVVEVGRVDLVPGHFLSRIARNLPHDSGHRAASHVATVVYGRT
jgi:hypothetical protein